MSPVELFGRFVWTGTRDVLPLRVEFASPAGDVQTRPAFWDQPSDFSFDCHGFETISASGAPEPEARFTPTVPGTWHYRPVYADGAGPEGQFECLPGGHPGFVTVSARDPRYFATTSGSSYVPLGLNLCWPVNYRLSAGQEFQTSQQSGTLGVGDFARWFEELARYGGNFARLWLGAPYFQVETAVAGVHDPLRFAALDRVVELARQHGIRLKLCLESFRTFEPGHIMSRVLTHPETGIPPANMDAWFTEATWQELWWRKVDALLARFGDDPVIMAWELWNEIDCCHVSGWGVARDWTCITLERIKRLSPRNLVTNSLGSFDWEEKLRYQADFGMEEMDFQQVHRYLDLGAGLEICREDTVALSVDAVQRARRPDRPILLAETGAVNDNHTGPFVYYRHDNHGIIFHDATYAPFFAGAGGTGHIWHWDVYVDQKNLWSGFHALADAVQGLDLDAEDFEPLDWSTPEYWCLILSGRSCALGWLRHKGDSWHRVLRDRVEPSPISARPLDCEPLRFSPETVDLFGPWPGDAEGEAVWSAEGLQLPAFRHGLVFRLRGPVTGA